MAAPKQSGADDCLRHSNLLSVPGYREDPPARRREFQLPQHKYP